MKAKRKITNFPICKSHFPANRHVQENNSYIRKPKSKNKVSKHKNKKKSFKRKSV